MIIFAFWICGLQVQKVFSQSAVFSGLTPGSLYHFAVRTEKESFTDSSPVSINITAGRHTNAHIQTPQYFSILLFLNSDMRRFLMCKLLAKWRFHSSIKQQHPYALAGVKPEDWWAHSFCPSKTRHPFKSWSFLIRRAGKTLLILPQSKLIWTQSYYRCLKPVPENTDYQRCVCVCVNRSYNFQGLAEGSKYTIELITTSLAKRSKPCTVILYTSKLKL